MSASRAGTVGEVVFRMPASQSNQRLHVAVSICLLGQGADAAVQRRKLRLVQQEVLLDDRCCCEYVGKFSVELVLIIARSFLLLRACGWQTVATPNLSHRQRFVPVDSARRRPIVTYGPDTRDDPARRLSWRLRPWALGQPRD